MSVAGIDLAWSARNRTGVAVVDDSGALVASTSVRSDDEIVAWLAEHAPGVTTLAVDAPLVVNNPSGMRQAEREVARAFGRYDAGPYPSHRGNPLFDPPRALTLAERSGWSVDPTHVGTAERPVCLEAYPHPAMVVLFGLAKVLPYKRRPNRTVEMRRLVFARLMDLMESLSDLALAENARWAEIRQRVVTATRPMHLQAVEDEIDAIFCAHLAWLWRHRPGLLRVYGDLAEGYLVAPDPPVQT